MAPSRNRDDVWSDGPERREHPVHYEAGVGDLSWKDRLPLEAPEVIHGTPGIGRVAAVEPDSNGFEVGCARPQSSHVVRTESFEQDGDPSAGHG